MYKKHTVNYGGGRGGVMRTTHALFILLLSGGCDVETLQTIGTYTGYVADARLNEKIEVVDEASRFDLTLTIRKGPLRTAVSSTPPREGEVSSGFQFTFSRTTLELWAELTFEGEMKVWGFPVEGPKESRDELARLDGTKIDCVFGLLGGSVDVSGHFEEDYSALSIDVDYFGKITLVGNNVNTDEIPETAGPEPEEE